LSRNLGTLTSWNTLSHPRPATALLYLLITVLRKAKTFHTGQKRKETAVDINNWNFGKKLAEKFATNFLGNPASSFPVLVVLLHQLHQ
jgi:hypothetical protein